MKKFFILALVCTVTFGLSYCSSSKKLATIPVIKTNYEADVKHIVSENCSPCHFPDKGGNKPPLDTYGSLTAGIDNILSRIEMHPGERGFMPFKHERLSDSLINVFKKWKADGLLEKK